MPARRMISKYIERQDGGGAVSEWKPIETAPKQGRILGYSKADGQHVWWWVRHIVPGGADRGSWENVSYEWYELDQPTHWMPLPKAPNHEG
ncbi:DUF551 domain-containing protein [Bradyrhizobium yuanmingense]|uniref:DUF551 domain-containing protein n=1 Tax=Bradyrhizobium yuanmingense TaxID=108015 RepID=UPI0009F3CEDD